MAESEQELRDKARTEYGIVNADDMQEDQLKAEMKAIDDQTSTAEQEPEQSEPSESEDDTPEDLTKLNRERLEGVAVERGVEEPDNKELYPTKADLITAIEETESPQE